MLLNDFRINYRVNPIGLDELPRLSWKIVSEKNNTLQAAYRICVNCGEENVWDSGKIFSHQSIHIPWKGKPLLPMTEYHVQVTVWDNHGESAGTEGSFETGLLLNSSAANGVWDRAQWITHTLPQEETACPIFNRRWELDDKPIKSARAYVTGCGIYELEMNGHKAGDAFFAPGWTSYEKRLQYQTYDITELLVKGENSIAITVANGWYKGYLGFTNTPEHYGSRTGIRALFHVVYEDGETALCTTDTQWETATGITRSAELYHGEVQDLTVPVTHMGNAVPFLLERPVGKIVSQESESVRITKRFPAKEMIVTPKKEFVIDFGQNMTGVVEVCLPHLTGEKLVIRHGETLDKDGNFYTENLRQAQATDTYIYNDTQTGQIVMPHFTFHGFRYICLEGVGEDVDISAFTACALHTDMRQTGNFVCDNLLVNQLQSNIIWGQRSNFLDVPTDCPQRDERLGWTGDAQVFSATASYLFETVSFFRKWLRDMAAETTPQYGVPHVVPNILGDQDGAAAWSDAATIIPWTLYEVYGDAQILEEQYDCMKVWVEFIHEHCEESGLWKTGFQYGDWLGLDKEECSRERSGATDRYLIANAYYALSVSIVARTAEVLDRTEDAVRYAERYERIRNAMQEEYVTSTGRLVSETQTACVIMLYFDLLKGEDRKKVLASLEKNLAAHKNHLTTGFVGTPYLCHCLSVNGRHDLAETVFLKEDFPSWLYAVKMGATTIWERWNSILPNGDFDASGMNSLNHYAYGSIGDWLYRRVAGILPEEPGYRRIRIQPMLTHGMTEVEASLESVYGTIKSAWKCRDGQLEIEVTVPANTTALIVLPEEHGEQEVGSGTWHYTFDTDTCLKIPKFSMDSTFGEVLGEKLAVDLFNQYVPGMLDTPMLAYSYDMTLAELAAMDPASVDLYETVVAALNREAAGEQIGH